MYSPSPKPPIIFSTHFQAESIIVTRASPGPEPMMGLDRSYDRTVLEALTGLIAAARPDWQPAGIRPAVIAAERRPKIVGLPEFTRALLAIALDPTSRTPARLAHEHPAWDQAVVANAAPKIRPLTTEACRICLQPPHPPRPNDHTYEPHEPPTTGGSPR